MKPTYSSQTFPLQVPSDWTCVGVFSLDREAVWLPLVLIHLVTCLASFTAAEYAVKTAA